MNSRGPIQSTDPLVTQLLEAVAESGMKDRSILDEAGVSSLTLHRLRSGKNSTCYIHTFQAIATVVGLTVRLEKS